MNGVKLPKHPDAAEMQSAGAFPAREWLDLRAFTRYVCVSERTVREWIYRRVDPLPAHQVGRKLLISKFDFDTWIRKFPIRIQEVDVDALVSSLLGKGQQHGREDKKTGKRVVDIHKPSRQTKGNEGRHQGSGRASEGDTGSQAEAG